MMAETCPGGGGNAGGGGVSGDSGGGVYGGGGGVAGDCAFVAGWGVDAPDPALAPSGGSRIFMLSARSGVATTP